MLCDVLRQLVVESGKTQKEIAHDIGLIPQRFNFYVNGSREPDAEMLVVLANYFGVSTDYLLGHTGEKKEGPAKQAGPSENALLLDSILSSAGIDIKTMSDEERQRAAAILKAAFQK